MSGGAVSDGRLWWAAESEFELAKFDEYKFGERMDGPTFNVVAGLSFAFQLQLYPNGAKYGDGSEVHDHMGSGIALVDGPGHELADFKFAVKVYKADGSLELKVALVKPVTMSKGGLGWLNTKTLPMAADKLAPYVLGAAGSEFVRVRVEFGIALAAFDALAHLPPPAPRQDLPERFGRWWRDGNGVVTVVGGDGKEFTVYKDQLTEASDVFNGMLNTAMKEGNSGRIEMKDLCAESLEEFISFVVCGAVLPSRLRTHVLKLLTVAQGYFLPDLKRLCERAVVEKMQEKKLTGDLLDLLKAAQTYELRVATNLGLCRLLKAYPQLSAEHVTRFNSADFAAVRERFMKLSCQVLGAIKC